MNWKSIKSKEKGQSCLKCWLKQEDLENTAMFGTKYVCLGYKAPVAEKCSFREMKVWLKKMWVPELSTQFLNEHDWMRLSSKIKKEGAKSQFLFGPFKEWGRRQESIEETEEKQDE